MANQAAKIDKLEKFFEEIIEKMDRQFTSHEFFLKLAHAHQKEYVTALAGYDAPFKELHYKLVKRLRKLDGKLITVQETNYPSRDIFGVASTTTLWRKK
jgi:5S rRNA maturation endonuclease (ribonuclease M5)